MTTATGTASGEVAIYLDEVAARLGGLPEAERAELLDDLAQHLAEVMAEPGPPLQDRIGPPAAYAAELLASAGMAPSPAGPGLRVRVFGSRLARAGRRLAGSWPGRELTALRPVLRPAWVVARAYLAVSLLAALSLGGDHPGFPAPRLLGSPVVGLVAIVAAVALSARLAGARPGPVARRSVRAASAVLVVYAVVLLDHAGDRQVRYVAAHPGFVHPPDACLRDGAGQPITNLYAYDPEGRLLDPVLLYDQAGRPIDNLCPDVDSRGRRLITEYRRDANGAPVINAFPRAQSVVTGGGRPPDPYAPPTTAIDPGDPSSAGPAAAVPVRPPAVVVPRLADPGPAATTTTTTSPAPGG